jgi:hypothetical protein
MDPLAQAVLIWDQERLAQACDRSEAVKAGVEAYLGRPVFGAQPSLTIRVHISEASGGVTVATVSQEDGSGRAWGERSVTGRDCESLDEPLTLVVALMLDAGAVSSDPAPIPAKSPEPSAAPPLASPPVIAATDEGPIETVPSLQHPSYEPGHAAVYASVVTTMGLLPNPGLGAALDLRLKPSRFWGLSLDAALLLPQREAIEGGRLELQVAHAGLGLCPLQGRDTTTWWSACGKVAIGRLHVRSVGLTGARSKSEWFAMPGLSVAGAWLPRGWLFLGAGLEAAFPASADRYRYRDALGTSHLAFEMSPFALTARLGVGLMVR